MSTIKSGLPKSKMRVMSRSLPLILASTSESRRALLSRLHINFSVAAPDTDETPIKGEPPDARALRLAEEKAQSANAPPNALVLGGDQTISGDGHIFDKPQTRARAIKQLKTMSGRQLTFYTAITLWETKNKRLQSCLVTHQVKIRRLNTQEIFRYTQKEPAYHCAGGAQIEGLGIALMEDIQGGDPTALVGMPLISVCELLRAAGMKIP